MPDDDTKEAAALARAKRVLSEGEEGVVSEELAQRLADAQRAKDDEQRE